MSTSLPASGAPFFARGAAILLALFALAAPWSIAAAQAAVVLGAVLLVVGRATRRLSYPRIPWFVRLVLALVVVQAITAATGVDPRRSLGFLKNSWIFLFPLVFVGLAKEAPSRRRALELLVLSAALAGLFGLIQHFTGIDWTRERPLEQFSDSRFMACGTLGHHLTYSGVLLSIFFVAIGLAFDQRPKWLWGLVAVLIGGGLLVSYARTAWIGAMAGLLLLGLLRGRRAFLLLLGGAAVAALIAALLQPSMQERFVSIFALGDDPRARLWQTALRIAADHLWLGAGLGAFGQLFPIYKVPGFYLATGGAHSDPLTFLVETGIFGLALWVAIWVVWWLEARHPKSSPGAGSKRSWLSAAIPCGIVALLVGSFAQNFSGDEEVAQVWWFLAVAGVLAARDAGASPVFPDGLFRGRRSLWRRAEKRFKRSTLPLAVLLFAGKAERASGVGGRAASKFRILVVRHDYRLGNLLVVTPFLRRLREALPSAEIGLVTGDAFSPLLEGWPWVDRWIIQDKRRHIRQPWLFPAWVAELRRGRWDLAFEASHVHTHSYYNCLLTVASGAPVRIGFDDPRSRGALTRPVKGPAPELHLSIVMLELLRELGHNALPAMMECPLVRPPSERLRSWLAGERIEGDRYLVLHVGGRGDKAWPLAAWRALLPRVLELFPGRVLLAAGAGERDRLRELVGGTALPRVVVVPPLSVVDLARLIEGAAAYVGCDSGVMHLAVSLGTPTVALFFRSNPYHYAPLGGIHRTVLLADRYQVEDERWSFSPGGIPRSPLLRAEPAPALSRAGIPAVDARALDLVADALRQVTTIREMRGGAVQAGPRILGNGVAR